LCSLVICSRSQEYRTASEHERLHLYSAIGVQPLTVMQQEEILRQAGGVADGLRGALQTNEDLRERASTPLWLNILLVATSKAVSPGSPGLATGGIATLH
jgi:hypothetical protein